MRTPVPPPQALAKILAAVAGGAALAVGLSACEVSASLGCQWRELTRGKYEARYAPADTAGSERRLARPLGRRVYARALKYRVRVATPAVPACEDLTVVKEVILQRRDDPKFRFTEINEYYTGAGELIATRTQDLTAHLGASGRYTARDRLPVPAAAPPGRYRMVSKLILTREGSKRAYLLSRDSARFRILPRQE